MANTILTPTMVTREALRILHQKLQFVGSIVRDYDSSFAKTGAKIGDTLKVRLPNQYTVRTGAALSTQDTAETSVDLTVATQKGVDVTFSSAELTLDLDDFSTRILKPAMSVLAANIEADALSMYKDVYNTVDLDASTITFKGIMEAGRKLTDSLAPRDDNRCVQLTTGHNVDLADALKGLFHESTGIAKQYREGMMGRTAGFDFYENTLLASHATGTAAKTTGYLTDHTTPQTGASIEIDTGTTTFLVGDVITIAGVNAVHPETKADLGVLQQFAVTADSGASATLLAIAPAIVATGAKQNVSNAAANNQAIVKVGAGASEVMTNTLAYHKEAFAFATADLLLPDGVHFAAREVFDGISMRIIRDYTIADDQMPCRIDVLYGYKAIRPQLGCRIHADG